MIGNSWVLDAIGDGPLGEAQVASANVLIGQALGGALPELDTDALKFIAESLELAAIDCFGQLESGSSDEAESNARIICERAFEVMRILPSESSPFAEAERLLKTAAIGVLGDRGPDVSRYLRSVSWPDLPLTSSNWGVRTKATVYDCWLRLIRKDGWPDFDAVLTAVVRLREAQGQFEENYLDVDPSTARQSAWELIASYHLARAAELVATFYTQGNVDGRYDIQQQLEAQFDRALIACARAELILLDPFVRIIAATARQVVNNSIWAVTRAVNSRVTKFVHSLTAKDRAKPIFEVLPPQRKVLREQGLLGSGHRSVVVNLPTSSGKTFIAQFRILQALNQFDQEKGWVAYIAPTKALVNQVTSRLRKDFSPLGVNVERVSPALEVDSLEAGLLSNKDGVDQFRILVTTPEKLDLLLRGGWEAIVGRPLTLVVVDEAHNIAQGGRGIRLELLLATINRECRYAQFLLLTPFIRNAEEVARWLAPDSHKDIELSFEWKPNDRAIGIIRSVRGSGKGAFRSAFHTLHTSKNTLNVPSEFEICSGRPLGLSWSSVSGSLGASAAAAAMALRERGPTIVLANRVDHAWSIAKKFKHKDAKRLYVHDDVALVQRFVADEMGADFELIELLQNGVGVHHSGISDELRSLMEWLLEEERINVLISTTTIAQGVNFLVSSVVMASHQYPYGVDMPPEDFWNLAGRVGRADQAGVGIVALVADSDEREKKLTDFVQRNILSINSRLIQMMESALALGSNLSLHQLFHLKEWSSFLQYIAHTYRQVGGHEQFALEIEQILRGSYGYQELRRTRPQLASMLLAASRQYADRLRGKALALVDSTGFSWESVSITLNNLSKQRLSEEVWDVDNLFDPSDRTLQKLMGVLLEIPELREDLEDATGGRGRNGDMLARMIKDWVSGATIADMAKEYFSKTPDGKSVEWTDAVSVCARNVYGRLSQTTAWGLAAIQAMTLGKQYDSMSDAEKREIKNLPSRVLYGVNTDNAVALRLIGVPRRAAERLSSKFPLEIGGGALQEVRRNLAGDASIWTSALGDRGSDYKKIWTVLEGTR